MLLVYVCSLVLAALPPEDQRTEEAAPPALAQGPGWAFEINVLWPFFPGGLTDMKLLVPLLEPSEEDWRGELILGLHSDFGWRSVRAADAGRVALLAAKLGYRQFLVYGLHLELSLNAGWRHEEHNPWDGAPIDSFHGRLWAFGGWQTPLAGVFYVNARGGLGVHAFRTDRFAAREKQLVPAGDLNLGVRF